MNRKVFAAPVAAFNLYINKSISRILPEYDSKKFM